MSRPRFVQLALSELAVLRLMNPSDFAAALVLKSFAFKEDSETFPSVATIAEILKANEKTVRRSFKALQESGIITMTQKPRQHMPAKFRVNLKTSDRTTDVHPEKPQSGHAEAPDRTQTSARVDIDERQSGQQMSTEHMEHTEQTINIGNGDGCLLDELKRWGIAGANLQRLAAIEGMTPLDVRVAALEVKAMQGVSNPAGMLASRLLTFDADQRPPLTPKQISNLALAGHLAAIVAGDQRFTIPPHAIKWNSAGVHVFEGNRLAILIREASLTKCEFELHASPQIQPSDYEPKPQYQEFHVPDAPRLPPIIRKGI